MYACHNLQHVSCFNKWPVARCVQRHCHNRVCTCCVYKGRCEPCNPKIQAGTMEQKFHRLASLARDGAQILEPTFDARPCAVGPKVDHTDNGWSQMAGVDIDMRRDPDDCQMYNEAEAFAKYDYFRTSEALQYFSGKCRAYPEIQIAYATIPPQRPAPEDGKRCSLCLRPTTVGHISTFE